MAAGPSIFFPEAPTAAWPRPLAQGHAHAGQGHAPQIPIGLPLKPRPRPYRLTTPLSAVAGETRLPQTVVRNLASSTASGSFTCNERLLSTYYVPGPVLHKFFTNVTIFNPQNNQLCEVLFLSTFIDKETEPL